MRGKSIIPDFMVKNPTDTFCLLLPLKLHLDEDKYGNSHFKVVIKNMTQKEVFTYDLSPELLFTHFPVEKTFINGKLCKEKPNKSTFTKNFNIDTSEIQKESKVMLSEVLDEKSIVDLSGWKRTFLNQAKSIHCYIFDLGYRKLIIPEFTIAIYYYFRFSEMREAALDCHLEELYDACHLKGDEATIILNTPRNKEDAAFIHRYASQKTAQQAFDNIGKYIHNYLNFMRKRDIDKEINEIPIRATFPVQESFQIDTRCSIVENEDIDEKYYFVHEIINDYSDIGFKKLNKITQQNKVISNIDEIENLPLVNREVPDEVTETLRVTHANKKYSQSQHKKDKKESCGSLAGIAIEEETKTKETILDLIKIYQEQETNSSVDQSLTEAVENADKEISKVIISSEFEKETEKNPLNEIDNFTVFKQYMNFLETQDSIHNFQLSEVQYLPELINEKTEEINKKAKMKKRQRQYLIATFEYKGIKVGLLELENYPSSATASWVILSKEHPITQEIFNSFISLFLEKDISTTQLKKTYQKAPFKFTTKNHEREENLNEIQLTKWLAGLIGKLLI